MIPYSRRSFQNPSYMVVSNFFDSLEIPSLWYNLLVFSRNKASLSFPISLDGKLTNFGEERETYFSNWVESSVCWSKVTALEIEYFPSFYCLIWLMILSLDPYNELLPIYVFFDSFLVKICCFETLSMVSPWEVTTIFFNILGYIFDIVLISW